MPTRDLIENVTTILHWTDFDGGPDDVRGDFAEEAENERAQLAERLRLAWDEGGEDPLLGSLALARDRMLDAEHDLRLLIAYGREFAEPRPYRLEDLARAAGMSVSGTRTAYDDEEVSQVAEMIGLPPRRSAR